MRLRTMVAGFAGLLAVLTANGTCFSRAWAESIEDKVALCASCHGEKGIPADTSIPIIWGQAEGYLYLQLRDMKKGARQNEMMSEIVKTLERDDMKALAAYFAEKPWPALGQPSASDEVAKVALTAESSIGCKACHTSTFEGNGTVPRLAGQSHDYLVKTLADFRSGARANNPGMTSLAQAASDKDVAALATYLAGM